MSRKLWALKKSPWVFHVSGGSCNNCDIEILDALTPKFDLERFGIRKVGTPRHADAILLTGVINRKNISRILRVYEQTAKPCIIIAVGTCACNTNIFEPSYNVIGPADKHLPISAYVPGCPPKPEAIIMGVVKVLGSL